MLTLEMVEETIRQPLSLAYLREKFSEFNAMCFEGTLPTPVLRISNSRTMLGSVRYKKERRLFRKPSFHDFTLSISAYYRLNASELEDVILHEMIHLDILCHQQVDDSAHGPLFRQKMEDINHRFNRHITISHKGKLTPNSNKKMQNIIAVSHFEDGRWGVTRVSPSKVHELQKSLPRYYKLQSISWFNSSNPYFANYPRSLTPKIYRVDEEELHRELEGAIAIQHLGGNQGS